MKSISVVAFYVIPLAAISYAQTLDTLWTKTYDGLGYEEGCSIQQTADNGFIIVGSTGSTTFIRDVYLLRTDSLGDTLWTRRYGGNMDDRGWVVHAYNDGFVIAGYTASYGMGDYDFFLIRTDSLGDTLWTKTYGGSDEDRCFAARATSDHGFILAGRTMSFGTGEYDIYVVKTDSLGDTLWTKTYGGSNYDVCADVQPTTDSGYIFVGGTMAHGPLDYDVYLVKTDSRGDTLWTKRYGREGEYFHDAGYSVQQTLDGGFIITGFTSYGQPTEVYLLKTDAQGDTVWTRYWGGSNVEWGVSVIQTPDGRFTIAARDYGDHPPNSDSDIWLLRVDTTGDTMWTTHYGDIVHDEWPESMVRTSDGGYAIIGRKALHAWELGDIYLVKTVPDALGILEQKTSPIVNDHIAATIVSGPLHLPIEKDCRVFDITGRVVSPDKIRPGIYFVEIDGRISQKVVKVK